MASKGEPHAHIAKLRAAKPCRRAERIISIDGVRAEYADGLGPARRCRSRR